MERRNRSEFIVLFSQKLCWGFYSFHAFAIWFGFERWNDSTTHEYRKPAGLQDTHVFPNTEEFTRETWRDYLKKCLRDIKFYFYFLRSRVNLFFYLLSHVISRHLCVHELPWRIVLCLYTEMINIRDIMSRSTAVVTMNFCHVCT